MESELDLRFGESWSLKMLRAVSHMPRMEIWKMRPRLRSTLSLSRDSPQPSHESAREKSATVSTSCSAMVKFSKHTRNTDPSEDTTVAGRSIAAGETGKARCTWD